MYICHSCETRQVWPMLTALENITLLHRLLFFQFGSEIVQIFLSHWVCSRPWVRDIAGPLQNTDEESNFHVKLADSQGTRPNIAPSVCFQNCVILISNIHFPGTSLACWIQTILKKFEKSHNTI